MSHQDTVTVLVSFRNITDIRRVGTSVDLLMPWAEAGTVCKELTWLCFL